jgi:hypothetical protein
LIAGDEAALARKLKVPVISVVGWLLHDDPCPADIFLRAVDLVVSAKDTPPRDPGALLEEVEARHRYRP